MPKRRDPIVEEVRANRAAIAREHGNDLKAIVASLKRKEGSGGHRVMSLRVRRGGTGQKRKAG